MNKSAKVVAYVVLALCALWLGIAFFRTYALVMTPPPPDPLTSKAQAVGDASNFHSQKVGQMMTYGAGLFLVVVSLALLASHDLTHYFADRVEEFIFDDKGEAVKNPAYEHAEQVWADGHHLEAIQLLRDYLEEHPREQFVALRIAEIYENDLNNPVAATLEYEEILKKKLPSERWGWAAIHLANLYSGRLNRVKDAEALLHRIVNEHGQTAAAKKARERLGIPDPEPELAPAPPPAAAPQPVSLEQQMAELHAEFHGATDPPSAPADPVPIEPDRPGSKLPPGFRPKTG